MTNYAIGQSEKFYKVAHDNCDEINQQAAVSTQSENVNVRQEIDGLELFPPRLTPKPIKTHDINSPVISLNGVWRFNPTPPDDFPDKLDSLNSFDNIEVPGEWVMQGYDVPEGKAAGYYREFSVRIILKEIVLNYTAMPFMRMPRYGLMEVRLDLIPAA